MDGAGEGQSPYIGDQIYVWLNVILMAIVTLGVLVALAAVSGTRGSSGVQAGSSASLLAPLICVLPLFAAWAFVLKGIYDGRKWAFIFELVTTIIFVALPNSGASASKFAAASGIGVLFTIARCVYFAMRLGSAVGPPLR